MNKKEQSEQDYYNLADWTPLREERGNRLKEDVRKESKSSQRKS